ncbi:MAG: MarR family transcriptional regulator [Spongiibacteraceae bacterium]
MTKPVKTSRPARIEALRLENQLCFALYATTNRMTRLYQPLLAELGITYPQYLVLLVLWEQAPRSVGAIGQELDLDSGTLTPLLKRLETAGFVTRIRDTADERRVIISLTEAGAQLRERAAEIPGQLACRVQLSRAEAIALREQLKQLQRALAMD